MHLRRAHRIALAWFACFAFLTGALAPALSQALSQSAGPAWAELCSAAGGAPGNTDPAAPAGAASGHCPFCSLHAPVLAPPPVLLANLPVPLRARESVPPFLAAPRTLFAWATAQARAPPGLS